MVGLLYLVIIYMVLSALVAGLGGVSGGAGNAFVAILVIFIIFMMIVVVVNWSDRTAVFRYKYNRYENKKTSLSIDELSDDFTCSEDSACLANKLKQQSGEIKNSQNTIALSPTMSIFLKYLEETIDEVSEEVSNASYLPVSLLLDNVNLKMRSANKSSVSSRRFGQMLSLIKDDAYELKKYSITDIGLDYVNVIQK